MDKEMLKHVIDIKERLSSIEAKNDEAKGELVRVANHWTQLEKRVTAVETDMERGKASIKLLQWVIVTAIAAIAAIAKVIKI